MYVRFGRLSGCLYIRNGGKSFSVTRMYSKMFGIIVVDNRYIRMGANISFKYPNIWYSSRKFFQPQITYASSMVIQVRWCWNSFFLFLIVYCQNHKRDPSNDFGETKMTLYIFLSIRRHITASLATAFELSVITDSPMHQIESHQLC